MSLRLGAVSVALVLFVIVLSSCGPITSFPGDPLEQEDIDRVQVVLAMGNPEYGADCRMITDADEVRAMVRALDGARIGGRVRDMDLYVAQASRYRFFSGDRLVREHFFNGNDTERAWVKDGFRYVTYPEKTPYDLYRGSGAPVYVVDEDLEEMIRPD